MVLDCYLWYSSHLGLECNCIFLYHWGPKFLNFISVVFVDSARICNRNTSVHIFVSVAWQPNSDTTSSHKKSGIDQDGNRIHNAVVPDTGVLNAWSSFAFFRCYSSTQPQFHHRPGNWGYSSTMQILITMSLYNTNYIMQPFKLLFVPPYHTLYSRSSSVM